MAESQLPEETSQQNRTQTTSAIDQTFAENLTLEDRSVSTNYYQDKKTDQQSIALHVHKENKVNQDTTSSDFEKSKKENRLCNSVAFNIPIKDLQVNRQPPKRLCNAQRKEVMSVEVLNEKQMLAERRRKQQQQNRLKRIHQRQEDARKLAQSVDVLLQQRALAQGKINDVVKRMSPNEILSTANEVAHNFKTLKSQLGHDFAINDREVMVAEYQNDKGQEGNTHSLQSVSFTVEFTGHCNKEKRKNKPKILTKQKKKVELTAEDLEEKQSLATERRNIRKQARVQRVRKNREVVIAMANDIERLKLLQSSTSNAGEAARLSEKIASSFHRLGERYKNDLDRSKHFLSQAHGSV